MTQGRGDVEPGLCLLLAGLPGTGKYTIGSLLTDKLAASGEARLVDNHYAANPILALVAQDGVTPLPKGVWERVKDIRSAVLETIADLSPRDWSFVFTADLAEDDDSYAFVQQLSEVAAARGTELLVIRLVCDLDELRRRIVDPHRRRRMKSTSEADAIERHAQGLARLQEWSPMNLDVTATPPDEAVDAVLRWATAERRAG
jgi:hypothetical protein